MANRYAQIVSPRTTPQSQPIPGRPEMVKNDAGGFVFQVKPMDQLHRFLILGSEGGTYYAGERETTIKNVQCLDACLAADADATIHKIVSVSKNGQAPKNAPAVFCMAYIMGKGGELAAKVAPYVKDVCRIPTDMFAFVAAVKEFRGLGGRVVSTIADWYNSYTPEKLAYHVTKYQSRDGWSHKDLLAIGHPKPISPAHAAIFRWCVAGPDGLGPRQVKRKRKDGSEYVAEYPDVSKDLPELFAQIEEIKAAKDPKQMAKLIRQYHAVREVIPTEMLNSVEVWEALLESMPLNALVRNLGKMTNVGLIKPLSNGSKQVIEMLNNKEAIKKARLHPMSTLLAMKVYEQGRGVKGGLAWSPVPQVTSALNDAFYHGFDAVEPTGKNWIFGIDVSASMTSHIAGTYLECCEAATAMAMVGIRTEPNTFAFAFDTGFKKLPITKQMSLQDALRYTRSINGGGTNCALPMEYALANKIEADAFVVLTDNETWAGSQHACQALNKYRQGMGRNAKLIVVAMTPTGHTIADPNDPGMLDVAGFDTTVPTVMSSFVRSGI